MQKHKFASISLTVRDGPILSEFSTHMLNMKNNETPGMDGFHVEFF